MPSRRGSQRGLFAWFLIGLASVAAYTYLAFIDAKWWEVAPWLVLIVCSLVVCFGAAMRRG